MTRHLLLILLFSTSLTGCTQLFFHPQKQLLITPDRIGLEYQTLTIPSANSVQLHGWLLKTQKPLKGTLLFFHGNAENISTHIRNVYWLTEFGYQVVLTDYRGYGNSTGTPDVAGALNDIVNTARFVFKNNIPKGRPVFVMGQSLGASLSITAFAEAKEFQGKIDGYIFEAAFADFQQIARDALSKSWLTWALQYPLSWTVTSDYAPQDYIHKLRETPILFVYSKDDEIIPFHHYEQLDSALNSKQSYLLLSRDRHIRTFNYTEYRKQLLQFLNTQQLMHQQPDTQSLSQ